MRDPFLLPEIPALRRAVQPWADRLGTPTLPLHIHEVLATALLYTFIHVVVSPVLSRRLFPGYYPTTRAKRANWDSHVVSLFQSVLINILAIWVMLVDDERKAMTGDWQERIWGYTGAAGMIQAFAAGYFVWDLATTVLFIDVFGLGLLAHAASALVVYAFGFRPFLNYYGCIFILYELSTPFLNIHWFFDKLGMTGTRAQLVNGLALLTTFFCCRLVWGTLQSARFYHDMWAALRGGPSVAYTAVAHFNATETGAQPDPSNVMVFAAEAGPVPLWLVALYAGSNVTLHALNWHWFFRMIIAVRKRFEKPAVKDGPKTDLKQGEKGAAASTTATDKLEGLRRRNIEDIIPNSDEMELETVQ